MLSDDAWHQAALAAMGPGFQQDVFVALTQAPVAGLWILLFLPAAITYPMAWFYMSPAKWFWYLW